MAAAGRAEPRDPGWASAVAWSPRPWRTMPSRHSAAGRSRLQPLLCVGAGGAILESGRPFPSAAGLPLLRPDS